MAVRRDWMPSLSFSILILCASLIAQTRAAAGPFRWAIDIFDIFVDWFQADLDTVRVNKKGGYAILLASYQINIISLVDTGAGPKDISD